MGPTLRRRSPTPGTATPGCISTILWRRLPRLPPRLSTSTPAAGLAAIRIAYLWFFATAKKNTDSFVYQLILHKILRGFHRITLEEGFSCLE